jgi:putative heme-binding domain-containing protein
MFDDPAIGKTLAANYRAFHPSERPAVVDALVSRASFARALLDQIAAGKIARQDLTAFHARQIRSLNDPALAARLAEVWGELRESPADRRGRMTSLKQQLDPAALAKADAGRGRALFNRICATCHKLYGQGGEIGPDLTGAGRDNLDYLLENLVDPSASVNADFRMVVVAMSDGRILNGLVRAKTDRTLTLQTQNETLVLDRREIDDLKPSPQSLMPEGLIDPLNANEVRDLITYLMSRTQVPLTKPDR